MNRYDVIESAMLGSVIVLVALALMIVLGRCDSPPQPATAEPIASPVAVIEAATKAPTETPTVVVVPPIDHAATATPTPTRTPMPTWTATVPPTPTPIATPTKALPVVLPRAGGEAP